MAGADGGSILIIITITITITITESGVSQIFLIYLTYVAKEKNRWGGKRGGKLPEA